MAKPVLPTSITITNLKVLKGTAIITACADNCTTPVVASIPRPAPGSKDRALFDELLGTAKFMFNTSGSGAPTTPIPRTFRWSSIPDAIRSVILTELQKVS